MYALAHQISLIDLSGAPFSWLRDSVAAAAAEVHLLQELLKERLPSGRLPLPLLRDAVRRALATESTSFRTSNATPFESEIGLDLAAVAARMPDSLEGQGNEVLLGFPAAPFALTMTAPEGGVEAFLAFARERPTHVVHLARTKGTRRVAHWEVSPVGNTRAYRLHFNLPAYLDEWIAHSESERSRIQMVEEDLLSTILIYRFSERQAEVFRLRYWPEQANAERN